jgi:hypothetical protein
MIGIVILVSGVLILSWRTGDLEEAELPNDGDATVADQVDEVTMGGISGVTATTATAASAELPSHHRAPTEKTPLISKRRSTMESDEFYGI